MTKARHSEQIHMRLQRRSIQQTNGHALVTRVLLGTDDNTMHIRLERERAKVIRQRAFSGRHTAGGDRLRVESISHKQAKKVMRERNKKWPKVRTRNEDSLEYISNHISEIFSGTR